MKKSKFIEYQNDFAFLIDYARIYFLDLKINYPEMKEIKRIDKINEYIESSIISIRDNINYFDDSQKPDWKRQNDFFVSELQCRYWYVCGEGKIELTKAELEKLKYELKPHIDTELDSVIIFSSRQEKWLDKQFWGKKDESISFII